MKMKFQTLRSLHTSFVSSSVIKLFIHAPHGVYVSILLSMIMDRTQVLKGRSVIQHSHSSRSHTHNNIKLPNNFKFPASKTPVLFTYGEAWRTSLFQSYRCGAPTLLKLGSETSVAANVTLSQLQEEAFRTTSTNKFSAGKSFLYFLKLLLWCF